MSHPERIQWLMDQRRYPLAVTALQTWLREEPDRPIIHAFLALCYSEMQQLPSALEHARTAVGLGPELSYSHYILGVVLQEKGQLKGARESLSQALALDPEDADYHTRLGLIYWQQALWQQALQSAETALQFDPEHIDALNLRSMALMRMGEGDAAVSNLDTALSHDPENARVHANRGWSLLYARQPEAALDAFRQALRLMPELEWAREGMLEALRARYRVYRLFQRYRFWLSKYGARQQILLMILWIIALRLLFAYAGDSWPFVTIGLMVAYFGFVLMTWLVEPLFNIFLCFDAHGKYLLTPQETRGAKQMGTLLVCSGICLLGGGILGSWSTGVAGILGFMLLIPLAGTQGVTYAPHRQFLNYYTLFLGILAVGTVVSLALGATNALLFSGVCFAVGWLAFSWIANLLLLKSPD